MKYIMLIALASASAVAFAESASVLTVQRVNYKEEKRLVYDLVYDASTCQIQTVNPFDVYYRDNATGKRLREFSEDSQDYFGPRIDKKKLSPKSVALQFKAFDEIQAETGIEAEILVNLSGTRKNCVAEAVVTYGNKSYVLEHIDIKVTKSFGFPAGVEWVRLEGRDANGAVTDCVAGRCD